MTFNGSKFIEFVVTNFIRFDVSHTCKAFLRSIIFDNFKDTPTRVRRGFPWPMPMPYPDIGIGNFGEAAIDACLGDITKAHTNLVICILSWLHLGRPAAASRSIRKGCGLSPAQVGAATRIEKLISHHLDQPPITSDDLGRSATKVENVNQILEKFYPAVQHLESQFACAGYNKTNKGEKSTYDFADEFNGKDPGTYCVGYLDAKNIEVAKEIVPDRIVFKGEPTFDPKNIFEEVPVTLHNPGLVRALLQDVGDGLHGPYGQEGSGADTTFDRLDLSANPYLEKHLEFLCSWVDDLAAEQYKFQHYTRSLRQGVDTRQKGRKAKEELAAAIDEGWARNDAPRRMESLLMSNQIRTYCDQVEKFAGGGFGKLYLTGGLHGEEKEGKATPAAASS